MHKNYLVMAMRQLRSNRTNTFLNIFGLAVGIACAGLIFLWVEDELHFGSNQVNLGMKIVEGRDFHREDERDFSGNTPPDHMQAPLPVLVTVSQEQVMGHGSAIEEYMTLPGRSMNFQLRVVGVVGFICRSGHCCRVTFCGWCCCSE